MTNKIGTLNDLFIYQGREMYNVSKETERVLPSIISKVRDPKLKTVLERVLTTTKEECTRIEEAFKVMNESPKGTVSEWTTSMFERTTSIIQNCTDPEVCDAVIINAFQQVNHNKIVGFWSLCSYAKVLGHLPISDSFCKTAEVEEVLAEELTKIGVRVMNERTVSATR